MEKTPTITVLQAAAILISSIIGVGVLPLPLFAVRAADSGAPLVTLLGILIASFGLVFLTLLGMRFPTQSIIQYSEVLLGKWLGKIGTLLILSFFALLTSLAAREFGEVVVTSVLKRTPLEVTVLIMLLLAAVSTRHNVTVFAYIHYFYLPVILVPALLIVILSLKNAEIINLQPVWGNEPSGMITGAAIVAALLQGFFIQTLVIPAMQHPHKAMKASVWGMIVAGGLYFLIVIASVSVFGSEEMKLLLWPTLELAKTTSLPANILERLDAAFLAVWVTAVFTSLFSTYYLTIHSISKLFRMKDHRPFSFLLLPYVFFLAMMPQNILHMYKIIELAGQIGLALTVLYPFLLWLIAVIRRKKGERNDDRRQLEQSG